MNALDAFESNQEYQCAGARTWSIYSANSRESINALLCTKTSADPPFPQIVSPAALVAWEISFML